jgi:hypothetical protein
MGTAACGLRHCVILKISFGEKVPVQLFTPVAARMS